LSGAIAPTGWRKNCARLPAESGEGDDGDSRRSSRDDWAGGDGYDDPPPRPEEPPPPVCEARGTAARLVVRGVRNGVPYAVSVAAENALGRGPWSPPCAPPATPRGLPGAPRLWQDGASAGDREAEVRRFVFGLDFVVFLLVTVRRRCANRGAACVVMRPPPLCVHRPHTRWSATPRWNCDAVTDRRGEIKRARWHARRAVNPPTCPSPDVTPLVVPFDGAVK